MIREIGQALQRAQATLWRDLLGMAALAVAFFSLLHLAGVLSA